MPSDHGDTKDTDKARDVDKETVSEKRLSPAGMRAVQGPTDASARSGVGITRTEIRS